MRALKEGLAKTDAHSEVLEGTSRDGVQKDGGNDLSSTIGDRIAATKEISQPEATVDPAAARRAAELAELQETEADEERRRNEENKKHLDAQAARKRLNTNSLRGTTDVNKFDQHQQRYKIVVVAKLKKCSSPSPTAPRAWRSPPIWKNDHYTGTVR